MINCLILTNNLGTTAKNVFNMFNLKRIFENILQAKTKVLIKSI